MQVTAYHCPSCDLWLYQRSEFDVRSCDCGLVMADGTMVSPPCRQKRADSAVMEVDDDDETGVIQVEEDEG